MEDILKENERIDDLEFKDLKIIQKNDGFCFGIDAVLLSDFAKETRNNSKVLDLGTGTGILSILLTGKTNLSKIYGIELQADDLGKQLGVEFLASGFDDVVILVFAAPDFSHVGEQLVLARLLVGCGNHMAPDKQHS